MDSMKTNIAAANPPMAQLPVEILQPNSERMNATNSWYASDREPHGRLWPIGPMIAALLFLCGAARPGLAGTRTWKCPPNGDGNWATDANWKEGSAPQDGDDLVFPPDDTSGNKLKGMSNGLANGTSFNSLKFDEGGYTVTGHDIKVSGGITSTFILNSGPNTIQLNVKLQGGQFVFGTVTVNVMAGTLVLDGVLSGGPTYGITKINLGTLQLRGGVENSYAGATAVTGGVLELAKTPGAFAVAASSGVEIDGGTVRYLAANQISTSVPVMVRRDGTLDLNNTTSDIGRLTLSALGGLGSVPLVKSGTTGTLRLTDNVTAEGRGSRITGNLVLVGGPRTFTINNDPSTSGDQVELHVDARVSGGSDLDKRGEGDMELSAQNNAMTAAVRVQEGRLIVAHNQALGGTSSGTTVSSGASLELTNGVTVALESLTLYTGNLLSGEGPAQLLSFSSAANTWNGPISLVKVTSPVLPLIAGADPEVFVAVGSSLTLSDLITGAAGLTKKGRGTLHFTGPSVNGYQGTTRVDEGILRLAKTVSNGAIPGALVVGDVAGSGEVRVQGGTVEQIAQQASIFITNSGKVAFENNERIGSLNGIGVVDITSRTLTVGNPFPAATASSVYDGVIRGSGALIKDGLGQMTLGGANSYSGSTTIRSGTLIVNGSLTGSAVTVETGGAIGRPTLGGIGSVGDLIVQQFGRVSPGKDVGLPGQLTARSATFSPDSVFIVDLVGPDPGTGYDVLRCDPGGVELPLDTPTTPGCVLEPHLRYPPLQQSFAIIAAQSPLTGTFAGKPEGTAFRLSQPINDGPIQIRINYNPTPGDVVLTVAELPLQVAANAPEVLDGDGDAGVEPGECTRLYLWLKNKNNSGQELSGVMATLVSATPGVVITHNASTYADGGPWPPGTPDNPGNPKKNDTAFQFYTVTAYPTWQPIEFLLLVTNSVSGTFAVRYEIQTCLGSDGPPKAFPGPRRLSSNSGFVDSPIEVGNLGGRLTGATVDLRVTRRLEGCRIKLISPQGTEVLLARGTMQNLGSGAGCFFPCTFQPGDILDFPSLANKLKQHQDPVSAYLYPKLDPNTWLLLMNYSGSGPHPTLETALLNDLTRIVRGGSIYDERVFFGVILRLKTWELMNLNPQGGNAHCGNDLECLNRFLLEDAYPQEILKKSTAVTFDAAGAASLDGVTRSDEVLGTYAPIDSFGNLMGLGGTQVNGTWRLRVEHQSPGAVEFATIECWCLTLTTRDCQPANNPCPFCPNVTISGDVSQSLESIAGTYDAAVRSACPGPRALLVHSGSAPSQYDAFTFMCDELPRCITVELQTDCDLACGAIKIQWTGGGPFTAPIDLLGHLGPAVGNHSGTYSFEAPPNSTFVVFVQQRPGATCGQYTLRVSSEENCGEIPVYAQSSPNGVILSWPAHASGFTLEGIEDLLRGSWRPVVDGHLRIANGRYTWTNPPGTPVDQNPIQRYFRLRKH
jgi:autotransporter-associated beta strand protein